MKFQLSNGFFVLVILLFLGSLLRAPGQETDQPDASISGVSIEKLTRSADFCYLTSKGREKYWFSRERYLADQSVKRLEDIEWDLRDQGWKTMNELMGLISLEKSSDLEGAIEDERTPGAWLEKNCVAGTSLYLYQRRTETFVIVGYCIVKKGVVVNSVILGVGADDAMKAAAQAKEKRLEEKREELAKPMSWEWSDDKAKMSYCIAKYTGKYIVTYEPDRGVENGVFPAQDSDCGTCRVKVGVREKYKWQGCVFTVFQIAGDTLYYSNAPIASGGGNIVAVDLKKGIKLWNSPLMGLGQEMPHSAYGNRLNLELEKNAVVVFGRESYGDYIEIKDAKTGVSIGHKILTPGSDSGKN